MSTETDKQNAGSSKSDSQSRQPSGEEEFMIAADLTLYSNPINRMLSNQAPSPPDSDKKQPEKKHSLDQDAIAADMKQYTNPLAELDKFHKEEKGGK